MEKKSRKGKHRKKSSSKAAQEEPKPEPAPVLFSMAAGLVARLNTNTYDNRPLRLLQLRLQRRMFQSRKRNNQLKYGCCVLRIKNPTLK